MAREDLFRIKKILDNKRKIIVEEEAEVAKFEAMQQAKGIKV